MTDVEKIWNMMDWHQPIDIQLKGRALANELKMCAPFLQPTSPKYNKNIWDNCALVLSEKSDEELNPHLVSLLEWLQDMNWPGAFCIFDRLQKHKNYVLVLNAINICIKNAKNSNDEIWESNLITLAAYLHR